MKTDRLIPFASMEGSLQEVLAPASRPALKIYQALLVFLIGIVLAMVFISCDKVAESPVVVGEANRQIITSPVSGVVTDLSGDYSCSAKAQIGSIGLPAQGGAMVQAPLAGRLTWNDQVHVGSWVTAGQPLGVIEPPESRRAQTVLSWDKAREMANIRSCRIFKVHTVDRGISAAILGCSAQANGTVLVQMQAATPLSAGDVYFASFDEGQQPLWKLLFEESHPKATP